MESHQEENGEQEHTKDPYTASARYSDVPSKYLLTTASLVVSSTTAYDVGGHGKRERGEQIAGILGCKRRRGHTANRVHAIAGMSRPLGPRSDVAPAVSLDAAEWDPHQFDEVQLSKAFMHCEIQRLKYVRRG
jgi:hypothetical protein